MIIRHIATGIAALFLATGTAHAYDAELPHQMFGAWCQTNNLALNRALPNNEFYSKCENGYLFIFDKGLKYKAGGSCEFASIKFDRREDAYDVFVVRANCKGIVDAQGNPYLYSEIFEIATSEGQLSRRRVLPKDSARSGKGRKSVMFMRSVPDSAWWTDCRHGSISKVFAEIDEDNPPVEVSGTTVTITYDELRKLLKDIPRITRALKGCDAYRKCLDDRDAGKVKHCLANDRRWREFFTGAW
jgi:hypothetical protein